MSEKATIFEGQVRITRVRTVADDGWAFEVVLTSDAWPDECFPENYAVFDVESGRSGEKAYQERALAVIHELFREAISNGNVQVK
ncbi:MAG: hypothetical protein JO069_03460 [Verrucomicrobia bacterium]|nr:hypothetical protein [Verrucomicrobiota bacterium]